MAAADAMFSRSPLLPVEERRGAIGQHVADQPIRVRARGPSAESRIQAAFQLGGSLPSEKLGARLVYLMAPIDVFLPSSVPCGPRRISTRSRSVKSWYVMPTWPRNTSSTITPTAGSMLSLPLVLPMPRRDTPVRRAFGVVAVKPGARCVRSATVNTDRGRADRRRAHEIGNRHILRTLGTVACGDDHFVERIFVAFELVASSCIDCAVPSRATPREGQLIDSRRMLRASQNQTKNPARCRTGMSGAESYRRRRQADKYRLSMCQVGMSCNRIVMVSEPVEALDRRRALSSMSDNNPP